MITLSKAAAPVLVGAASLLALAVGCDSRPPVESSMAEATVKGTVTIKGKNATKGKVVFDPSNYLRKEARRTADINPDGTYEIKTLIGLNEVQIESTEAAKAGASYDRYSLDVPAAGTTFDIKVPKN